MRWEELEGYWLVTKTNILKRILNPLPTQINHHHALLWHGMLHFLFYMLRGLLLVAFWHAQLASTLCYKYPSFVSFPICYPAWLEEFSVF